MKTDSSKRGSSVGRTRIMHHDSRLTTTAPSDRFELRQMTFTGGIDFTPEGEEMLAPSRYVGEPSPEIDEAWNAIIGGESHYFSVSETEAKALWDADWEKYRDRIRGGWTGTYVHFVSRYLLLANFAAKA